MSQPAVAYSPSIAVPGGHNGVGMYCNPTMDSHHAAATAAMGTVPLYPFGGARRAHSSTTTTYGSIQDVVDDEEDDEEDDNPF